MLITDYEFVEVLAAPATDTLMSVSGGSADIQFGGSDDWHTFNHGEKIVVPAGISVEARPNANSKSVELKFSPFGVQ